MDKRITKDWCERKFALGEDLEVGCGVSTPTETLERLAFEALPVWAKKEILAYRSITSKTDDLMATAVKLFYNAPYGYENGIKAVVEFVLSLSTLKPEGEHVTSQSARFHINEIRIISSGGWSDHHDQDFGTKDADYCLDIIREHAVDALIATSEQISGTRAKAAKFIRDNDPFGAVFSQHELAQLEGCVIDRVKEAIPDVFDDLRSDVQEEMATARKAVRISRERVSANRVRGDGGCLYCEADQGENHHSNCTKPDATSSEQISGEAVEEPVAWQIKDKHGNWITLPGDWSAAENIPDREYRALVPATELTTLLQRCEKAEAERDAARKALEPFVDYADIWTYDWQPDHAIIKDCAFCEDEDCAAKTVCTVADLRAARNAMGEKPE